MPCLLHRYFVSILIVAGLAPVAAIEYGIDGSFNGGTLVDNWGASSHLQLIGAAGFGLDLGYQYSNRVSYDAYGSSISHSIGQFETSLLWQRGDPNFRFQALAGTVFSNSSVQADGRDVINRWAPGYRVGVGLSVPLFSRTRAFAETTYQGWFSAEMPAQTNWRYGIRLLFGSNNTSSAARKDAATSGATAIAVTDNPAVTIDPDVPTYIPGYLSQSLPPIIRQAELCKCYPAGPYTLQLGEFSTMPQAIRALEYRGLRQFFNSRAYQKHPQPVFLSQLAEDAPVSLYLGEFGNVEQMQKWRLELRKNGMQARFRKVLGTNGQRIPNPTVVAVDEDALGLRPKYSAEEIRRMNSLPEPAVPVADAKDALTSRPTPSVAQVVAEKQQYESQLNEQRGQLNQLAQKPSPVLDKLQVGPLSLAQLQSLLTSDAMKAVLSRSNAITIPAQLALVWDEANREAWLTFAEFVSEQQIDEWNAWLSSANYAPRRARQVYQPMGDVYRFALAQPLEQFSVEIAREQSIDTMLQQMRSPEVLWFQAFQRINNEPVTTSLNWSNTDQRYHLIVINVASLQQQQAIWSNLNSVGLVPGLAEE